MVPENGWIGPVDWKKHSPSVEAIERVLHQEIVGQDRAIEAVLRAMEYLYSGLREFDERRGVWFVLFFSGPTGVGKTELTRALAKALIGHRSALTQINCSEFAERHQMNRLLGAPSGYIGFDTEPLLTQQKLEWHDFIEKLKVPPAEYQFLHDLAEILQRLKADHWKLVEEDGVIAFHKRGLWSKQSQQTVFPSVDVDGISDDKIPLGWERRTVASPLRLLSKSIQETLYDHRVGAPYRSVVLFDEIEKAHPWLWNLLLQVMGDGMLAVSHKSEDDESVETVDFRWSGLVFTSNIGGRRIQDFLAGRDIGYTAGSQSAAMVDQRIYDIVREEAEKTFPPEFWARIKAYDGVVVFHPLRREHCEQILEVQLARLHDRLAWAGFPMRVTMTPEARDLLVQRAMNPKTGARELLGEVFKRVESRLVPRMNDGTLAPGSEVTFVAVDDDGHPDIGYHYRPGSPEAIPVTPRPPMWEDGVAAFVRQAWETLPEPPPLEKFLSPEDGGGNTDGNAGGDYAPRRGRKKKPTPPAPSKKG